MNGGHELVEQVYAAKTDPDIRSGSAAGQYNMAP